MPIRIEILIEEKPDRPGVSTVHLSASQGQRASTKREHEWCERLWEAMKSVGMAKASEPGVLGASIKEEGFGGGRAA